MHKNATKCNKTIYKWCKNKHGASKIIDTFEMYQALPLEVEGTKGGIGAPSHEQVNKATKEKENTVQET
jgi:hypothetical protein